MAAYGHPISSLPAMSSSARNTVASLLMGLAVLAGSCAMTASAQGLGSLGRLLPGILEAKANANTGLGLGFNADAGAGAGGHDTNWSRGSYVLINPPSGGWGEGGWWVHSSELEDGLPKVEVEAVNVTVHNRLDWNLPMVITNAALGSTKMVIMVPPKFGPMLLHAHVLAPASSAKLTIQGLPDKEEYVSGSNATSMVVALTGNLSIEIVKECKSPRGVRGLLLEVTNELETQTICAPMGP